MSVYDDYIGSPPCKIQPAVYSVRGVIYTHIKSTPCWIATYVAAVVVPPSPATLVVQEELGAVGGFAPERFQTTEATIQRTTTFVHIAFVHICTQFVHIAIAIARIIPPRHALTFQGGGVRGGVGARLALVLAAVPV
jgi:hypothetical protein